MYKIISDGSCDLTPELVKELDIDVIPFYITTDGKVHKKENAELKIRDLYDFMVEHSKVFPKTSTPSIQDYIDVFKKYAKDKIDVMCLCISSKFSGSFNSAMNAKNIVLDEFPDARIEVIDSTIITVLQGLLVKEVVELKNNGASFDDCLNFVERVKSSGRIFFTIDGLDYLIHGGRIGKLSGLAAGALGIKPIVIYKDGEITSHGIARGRKKAKHKVIEEMISYVKENNIDLNDYIVCVGFGYDYEEGVAFRDTLLQSLKDAFPSYQGTIGVEQIGATIAVHTGPHAIGLGLIKKA